MGLILPGKPAQGDPYTGTPSWIRLIGPSLEGPSGFNSATRACLGFNQSHRVRSLLDRWAQFCQASPPRWSLRRQHLTESAPKGPFFTGVAVFLLALPSRDETMEWWLLYLVFVTHCSSFSSSIQMYKLLKFEIVMNNSQKLKIKYE
jgi:hypothetical protein